MPFLSPVILSSVDTGNPGVWLRLLNLILCGRSLLPHSLNNEEQDHNFAKYFITMNLCCTKSCYARSADITKLKERHNCLLLQHFGKKNILPLVGSLSSTSLGSIIVRISANHKVVCLPSDPEAILKWPWNHPRCPGHRHHHDIIILDFFIQDVVIQEIQ